MQSAMAESGEFPVREGDLIALAPRGGIADQIHLFADNEVQALRFALAARRPLLVHGEPGVGKSQLARAAAVKLGRAFLSTTVDARTESRDLLWQFDAVERLADAQLEGAINKDREDVRRRLAIDNYLKPGPLWWAFDWAGASTLGMEPAQPDGGHWNNGIVLLVDEIDKGETDVPNGLLEALGSGQFLPPGATQPVVAHDFPLIIVTTNGERTLPAAFVRRCAVLRLQLPERDQELITWLARRGRAHFAEHSMSDAVLMEAARVLSHARTRAIDAGQLVRPGQAEYLDLLRAVADLEDGEEAQLGALDDIAEFALEKTL
jgi:MoxR-like ATPase